MKRNIRTKIKAITLYQDKYSIEFLEKMLAEVKSLIPENEKGAIEVNVTEEEDRENAVTYLTVFSTRIETDEEEAIRLEKDRRWHESQKQLAEEKEKRLYEKLKAKYEKQ